MLLKALMLFLLNFVVSKVLPSRFYIAGFINYTKHGEYCSFTAIRGYIVYIVYIHFRMRTMLSLQRQKNTILFFCKMFKFVIYQIYTYNVTAVHHEQLVQFVTEQYIPGYIFHKFDLFYICCYQYMSMLCMTPKSQGLC